MLIFFPSLLVCVVAGKSQSQICRFSQFASVCGCWKITNSDMPIFSVFKCVWLLENHKLRYADFLSLLVCVAAGKSQSQICRFSQFSSVCGCWKITNSDMPIFSVFKCVWLLENHKLRYADFFSVFKCAWLLENHNLRYAEYPLTINFYSPSADLSDLVCNHHVLQYE